MSEIETSRRSLFYGIAAAGVAAPVIAACGSSSDTPSGSATTPSGGSGSPSGDASAPAAPSGIPTSDIPVGGGAIYPDEQFVVTQPTEGDFKAFSITCTHSGCAVNSVEDGTINCPCHGSKFSIADGSVQDGPAPSPLASKSVTVTGSSLTVT